MAEHLKIKGRKNFGEESQREEEPKYEGNPFKIQILTPQN